MDVKYRAGRGMEPWGAEQEILADHLVEVVIRRLVDPLEILLGGSGDLRAEITATSRAWAAVLLGDDDQAAAHTAIRIVAALYPGDAPFDPPSQWWRTPLGQVVLCRAGHPSAQAVSYSVAGAMLGVTRQGVHDLVTRGKLTRHPDGGVTVDSVRARLNRATAARHQVPGV
jgi:hypothetical protein